MKKKSNAVVYFEIPVNNMDRAIAFYKEVFGFELEREQMDGYDMAFFPLDEKRPGITGALAMGDVYRPTKNGILLYFDTEDIEATLTKAADRGAEILYPKTVNEEYGFAIAEIEDSEGNRIGLRETTY